MVPPGDSPWDAPATVAGFTQAPPNAVLLRFAEEELRRAPGGRLLDIGCGAGRNLLPLARLGWRAVGFDRSWPMVAAAAGAAASAAAGEGVTAPSLVLAAMDRIPMADGTFELVIAHGIWNLARSAAEMRAGIAEAARVAAPGAALFVFTFSRHTLPPAAAPVAGESFVFTQFSGGPQCFLTADQLLAELAAVGFALEPAVPLREYNRPAVPGLWRGGPPVIYEAAFRLAR
jgi:SAM-dependent methyltransferase